MAIETKSRQETQIQESKRKTSSWSIQLNCDDWDDWDDWDEEDRKRYGKTSNVAEDYDCVIPHSLNQEHSWAVASMKGIAVHREDVPKFENARRFRCSCCGLHAIGIPEDHYYPTKWKMLTTSRELAEMSCSDILVEDILK